MSTGVKEKEQTPHGFENVSFDLRSVPIEKIRVGKVALRDVDRNSEDFLRLRDSIGATNGPMLPIVVRPIADPENPGQHIFGLVDGLQRYSCCQDLGFSTIPARVLDMDEGKVAINQIIANRSKIETKPVEYTDQLRRVLASDPTLTLEELAEELHCKVAWLQDRLSLSKLHDNIKSLVDDGSIPLAHAFALAKLQPAEEQLAYVEQAQTQGIQEFTGQVNNRAKELRAAARAGRTPGEAEWSASPHIRPLAEIKEQYATPSVGRSVCTAMKADTPEAGFYAGLAWALKMDPETVENLRRKEEDRRAKAKAEKIRLDAEKQEKAAALAREKANAASGLAPSQSTATVAVGADEEDD